MLNLDVDETIMTTIYESPDKGETIREREMHVPPPTPELQKFWTKSTYSQQRRDRLGDVIGDYLTDEELDARTAYEEILAEAKEWVDYHQTNLDKATEFYNLLLGHRPIDFDSATFVA